MTHIIKWSYIKNIQKMGRAQKKTEWNRIKIPVAYMISTGSKIQKKNISRSRFEIHHRNPISQV